MKYFCLIFLACTSVIKAEAERRFDGLTMPSADISLSFLKPALIDKVYVKEGMKISQGQLLASQNSKIKQLELERLKTEIEKKYKY